ncbi:dihydrolipoamide acetyltransferase family protein [Saccharopolyspora sp. SCSIO 74807]|uniref:dihydrolipoamide acetyltransferase family protein n=1 Tax=Saccharopolyspora sp. SCSIO 74807 TaxID=3118084 RepID=UPI0030CEB4EA
MSTRTFALPDLGEGLTEAQLVRWLVEPGGAVAIDAPVAEVETAKAMVEVPSPYAGVVAELHGAEGATIAVGAPLITVETARAEADGAPSGGDEQRGGSGNVLIGYGTGPAADAPPRRRRRSAPAPERAAGERPAVVSPLVRKLAKDRSVDLTAIRGSGANGLITRSDVESAATSADMGTAAPVDAGAVAPADTGAVASADAGADARTGLPIRERIPLTGTRGAIAAALSRSRQEIPEATTWVDVDATELVAHRAADAGGPGLLALVARFALAGLARFPVLNARVAGGEIQVLDGINLGIATHTDRGLVVPVVRDAHRLSARGLDAEIRSATAAAKDGSAGLTGGSFTLNNYGSFGVDGSAAIINHPEVAILGMGRILPRPWVVDGRLEPRRITQLSLVFDHRVCDGGTAAGFLRFVADAVESPVSALADL